MSIKIEINKKLNIINKIVEYYKTKNNGTSISCQDFGTQ